MTRTLARLCVGTLMLGACKIPTGGNHGGGNGGGGSGGGSGVASVTVSPATACLSVGQTVQLMATVLDSSGAVVTGASVGWQSDNVLAASVDQNGLVTGTALGSATITATHKAHNGTAGIALQSGIATATLRAVRGRLALGDSGVLLHYNGTTWTSQCSGTTKPLYAIQVSYLGGRFLAGRDGTILELDTLNGWWSFQTSGTTSSLYGMARAPAAINGTLVAVGAGGTIVGYDGTKWTTETSGTTNTLFGVSKVPFLPVNYAVGAGGTILHYDGLNWQAQSSGTTNDLHFVMVLDSTDIYVFGGNGTILHSNGSTWSAIPVSGLTATLRAADISLDSTGTVITGFFAVGDGGTILHSFDGVTWTAQSSGTTNDLLGLWVATDSAAFAVGAMGTILNYDGTSWSKIR
jgi:hypothetical protein